MSGFWRVSSLIAAVFGASLTSLQLWTDARLDGDLLGEQLLTSAIVSESNFIAIRLTIWLLIVATLAYMHADKEGRPITVHRIDLSLVETRLVGLTRFCTFTVWCWCLQCLFFSLTLALHLGLVPKTPMLIRAAVIMFEVSLSTALLVSSVVTFVLIPIIIREKNDASGFFTLPALMMHNANIFFMVSELVFSQVEVELAHLPFSVLFGIVYIMFSWVVAHRIGFFFYFFINYNFKYALASHVLLLTTLGVFYAVASVISHSFNPEQNALSIPVLVLSSMMLCTIRAPASNLKNA